MDDDIVALIVDNGMCKVGFAGDDAVFPSTVGHSRHQSMTMSVLQKDICVRDEAQSKRVIQTLKYFLYTVLSPTGTTQRRFSLIVSTRSSLWPLKSTLCCSQKPPSTPKPTEKITHVMFKAFNTSTIYIAIQVVLALCASDCITDILMDSREMVGLCLSMKIMLFSMPSSIWIWLAVT